MPFNLFLKSDDDLERRVAAEAVSAGRSLEEELRKRLTEASGLVYTPLTSADIVSADQDFSIILDITDSDLAQKAAQRS